MKELSFQPIAEGRTAEIFPWGDEQILKLYRDWCPLDWVDYEAWIARAIYEAGVPSPAVGEIVEVNGRRGLIYEHLDGISMLQDMNARPWLLLRYARLLAELQIEINKQSIPELPSFKEGLSHAISNTRHLSEELRNTVLAYLHTLSDRKNVCHGDYHPGNVIMTKNGPVVIDWMAASAGSPWTDVARTSLILTIGPKGAGKQVSPIIKLVVGCYHRAYLSRYKTLFPDTGNELNRWTPVIAAARLNEEIAPERETLIQMVKEGMRRQERL